MRLRVDPPFLLPPWTTETAISRVCVAPPLQDWDMPGCGGPLAFHLGFGIAPGGGFQVLSTWTLMQPCFHPPLSLAISCALLFFPFAFPPFSSCFPFILPDVSRVKDGMNQKDPQDASHTQEKCLGPGASMVACRTPTPMPTYLVG